MVISASNVTFGDLQFVAVPLDQASFEDRGAIYVIFERDSSGEMAVLNIGEASETGEVHMNTSTRPGGSAGRSPAGEVWVGTYRVPAEKLFSKAKNATEERALIVARLRKEYLVR